MSGTVVDDLATCAICGRSCRRDGHVEDWRDAGHRPLAVFDNTNPTTPIIMSSAPVPSRASHRAEGARNARGHRAGRPPQRRVPA